MVKGKKKIRRRKKGKSKKYFTKETQQSIVDYQNSDNLEEKHKIYKTQIEPAFSKLAENLIFIYGFTSLHDTYEDLKSDCVTFLYQQLLKFDETKGYNAFSYYNQIAKNFLIIKSKKKEKTLKKNVSIDDQDSMGVAEVEALREYCTVPSPDEQVITNEMLDDIQKLLAEIRLRLKNDLEKQTVDCIIFIFKNIESVDLLNKRAVFFYIREMTGLSAKQLTTNMATIKKHYRELRSDENVGLFF